jgi:hypothetical protein
MELLEFLEKLRNDPDLQEEQVRQRTNLAEKYRIKRGGKVRQKRLGETGEILDFEAYKLGGRWKLRIKVQWESGSTITTSRDRIKIL